MPKMIAVTIRGLYQSGIERIVEILEAGLAARAPTQTKARIEADRKLVDYIVGKLKSADEGDPIVTPYPVQGSNGDSAA